MLYVGIDPGEVWCGFAALDVTSDGIVRAEARTYSVADRKGYLNMTHDLLDLLPHARSAIIIAEDFRIRHVGSQRFNHGDTLRFLGALEYGVKKIDLYKFFLVPPNDHGVRETRELFGRCFVAYRRKWPRNRHPAWAHCVSAWRVLGTHLFQHNKELLLQLHTVKKIQRDTRWLPTLHKSERDFIAPAAHWTQL